MLPDGAPALLLEDLRNRYTYERDLVEFRAAMRTWEATDPATRGRRPITPVPLPDGHYICRECVHISLQALRRRKEQCQECGTALVTTRVSGEHCPVCDAESVQREEAQERERQEARAKALAASAEARRAWTT